MKQAGKAMQLNKRIFACVLTLCMIAYMFTGAVITAKASAYSSITTNTTLSNGDTLSGTISNCTVTIPSGVTVTVTGQITTSGTVNLVGGGKLLRGSSFTSASMFRVNSGSTLNVGTSGTTGITIDGISTTVSLHGGGITSNGGTVNLYSGAVISNHYISKSDGMGGGIYMASGTLNMYNGATVKDNKTTVTSTNGGGGIAIDEGAVFNMYGGTISGNSAPSAVPGTGGGGIFMSGTLNMYGGTISGNISGRNGGAVHIDGGTNTTGTPVMNMTGGLITGNSAMFGGGIEILAKAILNISAGKINSNTCTTAGGGIELDASGYSGALNINGSAEVTGNNKNGAQNNILIDKSITVVGNFTGSAGIIHETSGYNYSGQTFGTASSSYTGMENFFCDGKSLVGTISGTNVIWKSSTTALTGITLSSNSPKTGITVTSTLSPSGASATYQWYRNTSGSNSGGTVIVGATESSYTPVSADVGKFLYVVANGTGGCTGIVTSSATTSTAQYGTTVSTPTFSIAAGTYISGQSVGISCATSGADIYYTTDGSTPTSGSTKYTGPITVSSTATIRAIGIKTDCADSTVAGATYTIAVITAAPYAGTYDGAAHDAVALSGTQAGDVVTYSEDGADYSKSICPQITNAGSYPIYVKVSRTGAGEWESGEKTAVISKATGSITITGDPSKTCNGSPVSDPAVSKNGTGAVTYSYYSDNSGTIGTVLSGAPSDEGTYWVKAVMAEDSNYTSAEATRQFTISASSGELAVSFSNSGYSGQNLTTLGDVDWAVWGYSSSGTSTALSPDVRKSGGTAISALTEIDPGTHDVLRGLGQFRINHTFNWTNGTSPASAANVYTGIQHNVQATKETGDGFSFTVPADTQKRRLILYSAVHLAVGELTATLSDGSAAQVTLQQDSKYVSNNPSRFIIDYAAGSDGQTLAIKFVVTWNDNDGNGNAQIYAVALSNYHTATINVCKDGVPTAASGSIELRQSGSTIATAASAGTTGVYSALVLNGNYDVFIGGADSGTDISINAADNSTTINYYTVNYAVTDAGKASGSTIAATAGGSAITNGSVLLAGKQVVITATGKGADTYTYAWTGDGTSGQTTKTLTVPSLSGRMNVLCTVSGLLKLPVPTGLLWDSTTPGKAVWGDVSNASGYSVQLYRNGSALGGAQSTAAGTEYYDFTSDIAAAGNGLYTFKVTAKGDGTSYSDSDQSPASTGYIINTAPSFAGSVTALTVDENSGSNSIKGLLHVSDIDSGQTLTWSEKTAPTHGTLTFTGATASIGSADITPGGTIAYTPAAGYYGSDSFTVQVSDGYASTVRAISVTVTAVPDKLPAPSTLYWDSTTPVKAVWSAVANGSGYSVQLYKDGNALGGAISIAAGTLFYDFTSDIATAGSGLFTFKVTAKGDGYEYSDSDQSAESSGYDVNTVPAFVGGVTSLKVDENSKDNNISSLLHVNDVDSGQTLTWSKKTAPAHGKLTVTDATAAAGSADITPGGTITYTPVAGYHGNDSFTVQVSDGKATAERTLNITVTAVPDKLPVPSTLSWDNKVPGKAAWNAVNNASGYSVQLYKDGNALSSPVNVSAGTLNYDFLSTIKAGGDGIYTFKVTAIGDGIEYCDSDDAYSVSIYNYVAPTAANAGNNSVSANPASVTLGNALTLTAAGDRQNEPGVVSGDERYIPVSWLSSETGKSGSFEKSGSVYTSPYTPTAAGSYTVTVTFVKQIYNGSTWTDVSGSTVTKTLAVTASRNHFTVRFEDWDGTLLKQQSVAGGMAAAAPADPVRTGYTFTGWSASYDVITADLTITAQYKVSSFTVRFKDWDGTVLKTQTVQYGQAAAAPSAPKRNGYTFAGWDKDFDEITKNIAVAAQYTINICTVKFNTDGGSAVESQKIEYGGKAAGPKAPVKDGYAFGGWYSDSGLGNAYDFNAIVTSDITIFAKWTAAASSAQTEAQAAAQQMTLKTAFKFAAGDTWECITANFVMLGSADNGAQITWTSSNTDVVRIEQGEDGATGVITRPQNNDASVVITATVTKNGDSVSKTFLLIVKRNGASKEETREATERTASVQAGESTGREAETIYRTTLNDGTNIDYVTVTADTVKKLLESGEKAQNVVVRIDNNAGSPASEFAFEISADTVSALVQNGMGVTLESPAGSVTLSAENLTQAAQSGTALYFHIVPVAAEADEAEHAFHSDGAVFTVSNMTGQVFGTPKTIQTNMESFATTIILPLEGLSEQQLTDKEFLKSLCVYVEHDDDTTELVYGTLVYTDNVPTGIQFDISKFSRFQVVSVEHVAAASPWGWIAGAVGLVLLLLVIILVLTVRKRKQVQL